ncbi:hypothetical protein [Paraburkholderia sp. BL6665CI2N2]|uniref:hypothetical protein n=1 Tax=Paraburkholderia sp. BL6665CI2N2 TaxID=1938806 RepID=UPI0010666A87|nr:hypothetical protein [Paraburkholderia sp. BL6665CI2N2]
MAERLTAGSTSAINATTWAINMELRRQFESTVEAYFGQELMSRLTADHAEAVDVFLKKRAPTIVGRWRSDRVAPTFVSVAQRHGLDGNEKRCALGRSEWPQARLSATAILVVGRLREKA